MNENNLEAGDGLTFNSREIARGLNDFFSVDKLPNDLPFSLVLPEIYQNAGINYKKYFSPEFLETFHGLMMNGEKLVQQVYGTVFLSQEIIDKILKKGDERFMIFAHHPMEDQTSGVGFMPLPEEYLEELLRRQVSIYSLHTPLDINEQASTSGSIANALNLKNQIRYIPYSTGFLGVAGCLGNEIEFDEFLNSVRTCLGNNNVNFVQKRRAVQKIGIMAGGATDPDFIEKTIDQGCDTFLAGEYDNKLNLEFAQTERGRLKELLTRININLVEASHYSTERLVMVSEIGNYFQDKNLPYEFIEQDDPWY